MSTRLSFIIVSTVLLVAGVSYVLFGQRSAYSSAYGDPRPCRIMQVVDQERDNTFLLTTPSQQQLNRLSALVGRQPSLAHDRRAYQKIFAPEIFKVGIDGENRRVQADEHEVVYVDPVTAEVNFLDLLSFSSGEGVKWVPNPASRTLALSFNPRHPWQAVFEHRGGLYLLDTRTLNVVPIGDHAGRKLALEARGCSEEALAAGCQQQASLRWAVMPVWSPDGGRIAFLSNRDRDGADLSVWVYDFSSSRETLFLQDERVTGLLAWLEDGRLLVQESLEPGAGEPAIVRTGPSGGGREVLAVGDFIVLSPDNRNLVYASGGGVKSEVRAVSLRTGHEHVLYRADASNRRSSYLADFSSDGARLVVDLIDGRGQSLLLYDLVNQERRRLEVPRGSDPTGSGRWRVEGSQILEESGDLMAETLAKPI